MARALLVALACAACAAAARYGDYSGARMPQYGGGDYDAREPHGHAPEPDDYRGHSPDAPAALDYKYEEDLTSSQIGKTDPPPGNEVREAESWQQRPARKHKKNRAIDEIHTDPVDRFDPDDDFPKPRSSNRFTKHHARHKSRKFERQDDDLPKYPVSHRDRNDDSDEEGSQLDKDFRNDKSKKSFDDDGYAHRVGSDRVVRRKPRDRQMIRTEPESEELKAESDVDRWMLQGLGRAPAPGPLEERPAKRRRPPDAPVMRESDDDDELLPVGAKSRAKSKSYDEYGSDYYDMKRVMNIKKKLPTLMRRTTVTVTEPQWPTATNVAERELTALLGARRQRKDVPAKAPGAPDASPGPDVSGPATSRLPPTFAPDALSPALNRHWNAFIVANSATRHHLSACLIFLALINYLERYSSIFCYIKQLCLTKLLSAYSDYEKCFIS